MTETKPTFEQKLALLKADYAKQLPQKLAEINTNWTELNAQWSENGITLLHRNVHSLIGTSGTFGFTDISKTARELETILKPLIEKNDIESSKNTELENHIKSKLKQLFILLDENQYTHENDIKNQINSKLGEQLLSQSSPISAGNSEKNIIIHYVDDELASSGLLTQQLCSYGFKANHFRNMHDFITVLEKEKPHLVLLDLVMPDIDEASIFSHAKKISSQGTKVIFLSGQDTFENRLASVRAGAHAYLIKPADIPSLVGLIRNALQLNIFKPAHVLIVDDQDSIANFYSSILSQAGLTTTVETNPCNTLEIMHANTPDLLLLDLNMPNVSGAELAAIIRQHEQFQSIPILFLSAEINAEKKTSLLEIGSDDLLSKGMPPEELVRQIKSRLARSQLLTTMMYQDSLTGLLNHAQIQLAAERVFNQCKRQKTQYCIAMIDIDHFKKVNDTYGHLVGDKVIKALAYLLQQRLRLTDYIGRFGGEEFMLVLPDMNINDAGIIINTLRKTFAAIEFKENNKVFKVNFSAGIAVNLNMGDVMEQTHCADEALYRAKARGRNLVCASPIKEPNTH